MKESITPVVPTIDENIAWVKLTPEQQKELKPFVSLVTWKHEGRSGPVCVQLDIPRYCHFFEQTFPITLINYDDDRSMGEIDPDGFYCKWFTLTQAHKIAKELGVTLDY